MVNISHGQDMLQRALVVCEFCLFSTARDLVLDDAGGDGGAVGLAHGEDGGQEVVEGWWESCKGLMLEIR